MSSSMKHRKQHPHQQHQLDNDTIVFPNTLEAPSPGTSLSRELPPDSGNGKFMLDLPKLHGKGRIATRCAGYNSYHILVFTLGLTGALLTTSLMKQYINKQSHTHISIAPTVKLVPRGIISNDNQYLPLLSTLTSIDDSKSLNYGESPLIGTYSLDNDNAVKGTIEFPSIDLSTVLKEEALTGSVFLRTAGVVADESLLNDSTFKSVIVDDNRHSDHALVTRCGYKMGKVPNQDRSFIANFADSDKEGHNQAMLMGIFDGHGGDGHKVSHFIALNFLKTFTTKAKNSEIKQALIDTFIDVDDNEPVKGQGGSTCSVVYYPGSDSKVYVANTGDSTTLIVSYSTTTKKSTIVYQNRKHKPHLADERQRIEAAGGQVMIPPSLMMGGDGQGQGDIKETSRLIIPAADGNPLGGLALAMSRSIGDFDGKNVGLIAEPEVDEFDMSSQSDVHYFAISASDGIYDVLSAEVVADYLGKSLYEDGSIPPLEACERLVRDASRLWKKASGLGMTYRDDITVGVSKINFVTS